MLILTALTLPASARAPAADSNAKIYALAESYFDGMLALTPSVATQAGEHRYDDRLERSAAPAYQRARVALAKRYRAQVERIDVAALDDESLVIRDVLLDKLDTTIAGATFPEHLFAVNQMNGLQEVFIRFGSGDGAQPFRTVDDYERFLRRSRDFVTWVDDAIAGLREGVRRGITYPHTIAERNIEVLRGIGTTPVESSPFWQPITNLPADIPAAERERLTAKWRSMLQQQVLPAYARLADVMEHEYLPKTRTTVGWSALPNGAAWYRQAIRVATTLEVDPEETHALGLRQVAHLREEMEAVRKQVGFEGDLAAFFHYLQTDPRFYFSSGPEMVAAYQDVKRRVDSQLPRLFGEFPKIDYEIREMEPYRAAHVPGAQYQAAPPDKSRPGVFFVNTHDLRDLPNYIAESLSLHEASPGHHFQVEIAHDLTGMPRLCRFENNSAYGEGWALYAESLGRDLGLYTDPYQWYGHLTEQMLRAMRLVVDTGLHAKGWTREQAIRYMLDNSSMAPDAVRIEVDRYLMWPGQALSYQIGYLKIRALRARAEKELGPKFDLKDFHRQLLDSGPLPMMALEHKIDRWIRRRAAAP